VINLSIASNIGYQSPLLNEIITAAFKSGFIVTTSAGNFGNDACDITPANLPYAISLGCSNMYDDKSTNSGWGSCVDLWVPSAYT